MVLATVSDRRPPRSPSQTRDRITWVGLRVLGGPKGPVSMSHGQNSFKWDYVGTL